MPSNVKTHVHQYVKYKSRPGYYRCALPTCTHFQEREMVVGKSSLCNLCGSEFILDMESAKRARPRCLNCSDTAKGRMHRAALQLASGIPTFHVGSAEEEEVS